jgi:hypothetical protein
MLEPLEKLKRVFVISLLVDLKRQQQRLNTRYEVALQANFDDPVNGQFIV